MPNPETCKFCGRPLYYSAVVYGNVVICWNRTAPERCTCDKAVGFWKKRDKQQEQKAIDERVAQENRKWQQRVNFLIGGSGIKKRFLLRTFENYEISDESRAAFNAAKEYADSFESHEENGEGLIFEGTYGTGKTHLAVAIANDLMKRNIPVICKTYIDISADVKRAYDESETSEKPVIDLYKDVRLLIIDDLGKEQCTSWSVSLLYDILNSRYEDMLPTIITTNYNEDMLIKRLTPKGGDSSNIRAMISRFRECTNVVTMAWEDYRSRKIRGE